MQKVNADLKKMDRATVENMLNGKAKDAACKPQLATATCAGRSARQRSAARSLFRGGRRALRDAA